MGFYERIDARGVRETGRPVSFVPKGALTHHPRSGRWYCLRQPCALRGGCGSCGSLWTMPPSFESAVIVHAVGYVLCFIIKTVVSILETTCRLPAQTCHRQLCRRKGVAVHDTLFFFAKETKIQERKDSENEWQSIILKQRWSAGERDGLPWQLPLI